MVTFGKHKWWILTAVLTAPLVAMAAGVPNVFAPGTVISSADVNANFKNLSDRVTALEASIATKASAATATVVMDNVPGPITNIQPVVLTTTGGTVLLIVSGSAWINGSSGIIDLAVLFDGAIVGHLKVTTNESNSHKSFPTKVFRIAAPAAGPHNVGLAVGAGTSTTSDASDFFNVTAVELGH